MNPILNLNVILVKNMYVALVLMPQLLFAELYLPKNEIFLLKKILGNLQIPNLLMYIFLFLSHAK